MDADIESVGDDVLQVTGTTAGTGNNALILTTIDPSTNVRQAQRNGAPGTNSALTGFEADQYADLQNAIEMGGFNAASGGTIDSSDLPLTTRPGLGTVRGPDDVTTALQYALTAAGSATLTTVLGIDTQIAVAPEIDVQGNGVSILSGDTNPGPADHSDFGAASVGAPVTRTFTIRNIGTQALSLTAATRVAMGGANAGDFVVTQQPNASSIAAAGGSATFQVRFTPGAARTRNATVSNANENPYTFAIRGSGAAAANAPPIANAGPDKAATAGSPVTLSGTFTDPGDARAHTFKWTVTSSNGQVIPAGTGQAFTFTPSAPGTYTATFKVTDASGLSDTDGASVTVTAAPVVGVTAGGPYTIDEGGSLALQATPINVASGANVAYSWDVDVDGTYGDATGASPVLTWTQLKAIGIVDGNAASVYQAKVRLTAGGNAVISNETSLTVRNVAPQANACPDRTTPAGAAVTLSGTFTDPGDADTHAFQWTVRNAAGVVVAASTAQAFGFTPSTAGTYTATLRVTDDDGGTTTDSATVTATPPTTGGPGIVGFTLINADTNRAIMPLTDGMTLDLSQLPRRLNVRAETGPGRVGSVVIGLDDYSRIERARPYALFSNWGYNDYFSQTLSQGEHQLFATAFSGRVATGVPGARAQITINVINQPPVAPVTVTSFVLFNTATGDDIRVLRATDTINLAHLPSTLGLRVTTTGALGSVVYNLTGRVTNDLSGAFQVGRHVITALPFTGPAGTGVQGASLEMRLYVVDSN